MSISLFYCEFDLIDERENQFIGYYKWWAHNVLTFRISFNESDFFRYVDYKIGKANKCYLFIYLLLSPHNSENLFALFLGGKCM